jgi:hypothetical protein
VCRGAQFEKHWPRKLSLKVSLVIQKHKQKKLQTEQITKSSRNTALKDIANLV